MIRAFDAATNRMTVLKPGSKPGSRVVWIDLVRPTPEEKRLVETDFGLSLPTPEEMKDIEPSSRLYREGALIFMTANVVWRSESEEPESAPISFILTPQRLVTMRYSDPRSFSSFAAHAERHSDACLTGTQAMIGIVESIIDRTAEMLERSGTDVDGMSRTIFRMKSAKDRRATSSVALRELLARLALNQNLVVKVRDSLVSLGRMMSYCSAVYDAKGDPEWREHVRSVSRDIQSLTDHASYITQTTSFLQDAALGLINLEQNEIIKIFSVAAVMFLPPTMIASIYGMNFDVMPELKWALGYPLSIIFMILSALAPFLYFKRRGWL
ncbi:MAG: magnesium transporter CorA family protein [Hyphomonadaceae bacterium]